MQPAGSGNSSAHPSSLPDSGAAAAAVDVPGRPDFVNIVEPREDRPIPATAVRAVTPEHERRTTRPLFVRVYASSRGLPAPEHRIAYAYVTPAAAGAPCKSDPTNPATSIRRAILAAVPRARFELQFPGGHGSDRTLVFASPEDHEAAMDKQPFALDAAGAAGVGASVRLVREGETSNVRRIRFDALAHVALLRYPREQRNEEDIRRNCSGFRRLLEIDPGCYAAPDLSPVRVVLCMEHHREIPREVRIRYSSDFRYRNVVPVQIIRLWDRSLSTDADGNYVPIYPAAAAAATAAAAVVP